ncbi:MAG: response regulator [Planctomycetes bacterium]|nr:response regulator [Planctomycetota bacterium]
MIRPAIICVDDQSEVLESVLRDIEEFEKHFDIQDCDSPADARSVLNDFEQESKPVALIISDHMMPGETGVDFLASVHQDQRFPHVRKLLLTGLATHEDTIRAINEAKLDSYIAKPWKAEKMKNTVKVLLTLAVFDMGLDLGDYSESLDADTIKKCKEGSEDTHKTVLSNLLQGDQGY